MIANPIAQHISKIIIDHKDSQQSANIATLFLQAGTVYINMVLEAANVLNWEQNLQKKRLHQKNQKFQQPEFRP